jgi:hypothetical protein
MATTEIPRNRWENYLDELSNREIEQPVCIRVDGLEVGDQELAHNRPLVGISFEEKGSEANSIEITLADRDGRGNFTHMIDSPDKLYVEEGDDGALKCLDIETQGKVKTLIFFGTHDQVPKSGAV